MKTYLDDDFVSIEISNFDSSAISTLVFAVIWNASLLFFYAQMIFTSAPLVTFLFPLIHLIAGIYLLYQSLIKTVNKTNIDVFQGLLTSHSGPIWNFLGNRKVVIEDIQQIYVRTSRTKNKTLYQLTLVTFDNVKIALTPKYTGARLSDLFEAEELIENYLGISDFSVRGEAQPKAKRVRVAKDSKKIDMSDSSWAQPLQLGDAISINNELFEVAAIETINWYGGGISHLVTIESKKDGKLEQFYQEGQLYFLTSLPETMKKLNLENMTDWPSQMIFMDEPFELFSIKKGTWKRNHQGPNEEIKQIIYQPKDDNSFHYIIQIIGNTWNLFRADIDEETLMLDELIAPEKRKIDLKQQG